MTRPIVTRSAASAWKYLCMGLIHGVQQRPRAIFEGLDADLVSQLSPLVGSHIVVPHGELASLDQREYDMHVTAGPVESSTDLHVVALGSPGVYGFRDEKRSLSLTANRVYDVYATQLAVPDAVDARARSLIERTVLPLIVGLSPRPRWRWGLKAHFLEPLGGLDNDPSTPLLTSHAHDEVLAFTARRDDGTRPAGLALVLPVMPAEVVPWLRWFINKARAIDPEAFPLRTDWHEDPRWAPPTLLDALGERETLKAQRAEVLADLDRREAEADTQVASAQAAAEDGPWRLLTQQGDVFESAAAEALSALGFVVERRDQTAAGQPKLEDLRLTDPAEPGWVALVECKGLAKGAQARAIVQLTNRPVHAYSSANGSAPDALYYVVNHDLDTDPASRPQPLESDPTSISLMAEFGGAVIDSRALLFAHMTALAEPEKCAELRAAMRASRGRWDGTTARTLEGLDDASD